MISHDGHTLHPFLRLRASRSLVLLSLLCNFATLRSSETSGVRADHGAFLPLPLSLSALQRRIGTVWTPGVRPQACSSQHHTHHKTSNSARITSGIGDLYPNLGAWSQTRPLLWREQSTFLAWSLRVGTDTSISVLRNHNLASFELCCIAFSLLGPSCYIANIWLCIFLDEKYPPLLVMVNGQTLKGSWIATYSIFSLCSTTGLAGLEVPAKCDKGKREIRHGEEA